MKLKTTDTPSGDQTPTPDNPPDPHVHNFQGNYQCNDVCHWRVCSCGENEPTAVHEFENGICKVCATEKSRVGLEYGPAFSSTDDGVILDHIGYYVKSVGSCTDTHVVIPSTYAPTLLQAAAHF